MNNELFQFLHELEPRILDIEMVEFAFIRWSKTEDFKKMIDSVISDRADKLLDTGDYEKEFDSNPFDVESQLVGSSGEWEFTDAGLEEARNDAKAELVEENDEAISEDFQEYIASNYQIDIDGCECYQKLRELIVKAIQADK